MGRAGAGREAPGRLETEGARRCVGHERVADGKCYNPGGSSLAGTAVVR